VAKQPKVKRLYLGFGDAYVPPVVPEIGCTYVFSMTNAQALGIGLSGVIPSTGQVATYTTVSGLGVEGNYAAGPDLEAPQTFALSTGTTVVEAEFVTPNISTDNAAVGISIGLYDMATMARVVGFSILSGGVTYGDSLVAYNGNTAVYTSSTLASTTNVVGFEMNATAGTFKVILNGSELTLSDSTFTDVASVGIIVTAVETVGLDAGDADKGFVLTLRTASAALTQTYASGAVDVCGNPI